MTIYWYSLEASTSSRRVRKPVYRLCNFFACTCPGNHTMTSSGFDCSDRLISASHDLRQEYEGAGSGQGTTVHAWRMHTCSSRCCRLVLHDPTFHLDPQLKGSHPSASSGCCSCTEHRRSGQAYMTSGPTSWPCSWMELYSQLLTPEV